MGKPEKISPEEAAKKLKNLFWSSISFVATTGVIMWVMSKNGYQGVQELELTSSNPPGTYYLTHIGPDGIAYISPIVCWRDPDTGRYNYYDGNNPEVLFTSDDPVVNMGQILPKESGQTGMCIEDHKLQLDEQQVSYIGSPVVLTAQQLELEQLYKGATTDYDRMHELLKEEDLFRLQGNVEQ